MKGKRSRVIAGLSLAAVTIFIVACSCQAGPVEGRPTLMYFRAAL